MAIPKIKATYPNYSLIFPLDVPNVRTFKS